MSSAFAVAAALRSRRIHVPAEWPEVFRLAIATVGYWEREAPEFGKAREVLVDLLEGLERAE